MSLRRAVLGLLPEDAPPHNHEPGEVYDALEWLVRDDDRCTAEKPMGDDAPKIGAAIQTSQLK